MWKKTIVVSIMSMSLLTFSCEKATDIAAKEDTEMQEMEIDDSAVIELTGDFTGASGYTTSGKASVLKSENNSRALSLTNFRTSSGPDLRVYLAEDKAAKNFIEISPKVENGNKTYALPSTVNLDTHKFVLIWCKAFSVSFGYVELDKP